MTPPILSSARDLLGRYDVLFCDVWGVAHDGQSAYPGANEALTKFRQSGGTVILVSNAPVPAHRVAFMLERVGFWDEAWDKIVSSGDIALEHVLQAGFSTLYGVGPRARDEALFAKLPGLTDDVHTADAVICTGLEDDINGRAEDYLPLLEQARELSLPFVCANPDLVVHVAGKSYVCAGAIGELYEAIGGDVFWAGKPHISAFDTAMRQATELRGSVSKERVLVIGDALRTDLMGAQNAGVDALFIAGGIHRDDTMVAGELCETRLKKLFCQTGSPGAVAAMAHLEW